MTNYQPLSVKTCSVAVKVYCTTDKGIAGPYMKQVSLYLELVIRYRGQIKPIFDVCCFGSVFPYTGLSIQLAASQIFRKLHCNVSVSMQDYNYLELENDSMGGTPGTKARIKCLTLREAAIRPVGSQMNIWKPHKHLSDTI